MSERYDYDARYLCAECGVDLRVASHAPYCENGPDALGLLRDAQQEENNNDDKRKSDKNM